MHTNAGGCGLLWLLVGSFFVFNNPMTHPRISVEEKQYFLSSPSSSKTKVDLI